MIADFLLQSTFVFCISSGFLDQVLDPPTKSGSILDAPKVLHFHYFRDSLINFKIRSSFLRSSRIPIYLISDFWLDHCWLVTFPSVYVSLVQSFVSVVDGA